MVSRVQASDLFSFQELDVEFSSGVTLIEGFNHDDQTAEGAGKSAILNTISWVLYGEIPKDVKIDDVVRSGAKGAKGTVFLSNGFGVTRSRKPNDVFMFQEGNQKIKGKDAKETQQMIEEMLGMSFKTFCQAVYFAQNYPNKFVTATEEDKGKILSEIEDLSQFDRARKDTIQKIKTEEGNLALVQRDVQHLTHSVESLNSQKMGLIQLKGRFEVEKKEKWEARVAALFDLNASYEAKKTEYEEGIKEKDEIEQKLLEVKASQEGFIEAQATIRSELAKIETESKNVSRLQRVQSEYETAFNKIVREVDLLDKEKVSIMNPEAGDKCGTCGQELSKADPEAIQKHLDMIDNKIRDRNNEMAEITSKSTKLHLEIQGIQIPTEKLTELKSDLTVLETNRKSLDEFRSHLQGRLNLLSRLSVELSGLQDRVDRASKALKEVELENSSGLDEQLQKIEIELEQASARLDQAHFKRTGITATLARLEALKEAFKEVKSFAFKNTLLELNYKANDYLSKLFNQSVDIRFYNESETGETSKIHCEVTIDGEVRVLGLYSGGQFRRIQLAVDLALSDLISSRNKNSINFRVFDESMKDLSETSMENCLTLLQSLKGTTLLIEHNSMFKSIVNQTIRVELSNKISRVIENHGTTTLEMQSM